jgi:inosose dehydratase
VPADGSAGLSEAGWRALGRGLAIVARQAVDRGIRVHYHNHAGSYVETPDEVERLLALADPDLFDLCFDTGHYAYGGGDPAAFVARHHGRIGYLHVKDVDADVLARARAAGVGFFDALRAYVFCELGQGVVPAAGLVRTLLDAGYRGWIVVEQDTCRRPSTESARISRSYLRERCGI